MNTVKGDERPFPTGHDIFRWGPIPGYFYYISEFAPATHRLLAERFDGLMWPKTLFLFRDRRMLWMNDQGGIIQVGEQVFDKYIVPEDSYAALFGEYKDAAESLIGIHREIDELKLSSLSSEDFLNLWRRFFSVVLAFWIPTIPAELGNYGSTHALNQKLRAFIDDDEERASVMEILTAPEEMSFYQREEIDLSKTNDLDNHAKDYAWLKNSYAGVAKIEGSFFAKRKKALPKDLARKEVDRIRDVKARKQAVQKQHQLPNDVMQFSKTIIRAVAWQDDRKEQLFRNIEYKDRLLHEAARRFGHSHADLLNLSYSEIDRLITGVNINNVISSRQQGFGFLIDADIIILDADKTKQYWDDYGRDIVDESTKELHGIVASKGDGKPVRGKVKVMFRPHQGYFNEGDILVAPMTSPEYVFAIKKAAAVITDAGGLTSHAAIVSRELNTPCIVGTKIATSLLRDGMEVEVDVKKGIVKII